MNQPIIAQPSLRLRTKLAAIVISSVLSLTLVELSLQLFFARNFPIIQNEKDLNYRFDSRLGWFPIPDNTTTVRNIRTISAVHNHDGFRDIDHPSNSNKPRVLFLGDSFVWGAEVDAEERFTNKLQIKHPEWEIYNCGISGYGSDQEYLLLLQWFDHYKPSLVFIVFCTENDDIDNRWNFRHEAYFKPYFTTNSQGLELRGVPVPRAERSIFSGHPLLGRSFLLRLIVRIYCRNHSPGIRHVPSPTQAILTAMKNFLESRGAHLAVGLTAVDKPLGEFLTHSGIPWLDLSTTNRFPNDGHWTPLGHDFVCDKLDAFLSSREFPPKPSAQSDFGRR